MRINRRRRGRKPCNINTKRGINKSNLININIVEPTFSQTPTNIHLSLLNAQSLKNKELMIIDYITQSNLDVCVVTETWFKDTDKMWIKSSEFNKNGYKIRVHNRDERQGGGLALIHKNNIKVKDIDKGFCRSFEYAVWKIGMRSTTATIHAIYHPPYSTKNQGTNTMFLDDLTECLTTSLVRDDNLLLVGDFNMHVNNIEDPDATTLLDTMEALGLNQKVNFPTHKSGNTLDLVFNEVMSKVQVVQCNEGSVISDHIAVEFFINIKRDAIQREMLSYRNLKKVDIDNLFTDCKLGSVDFNSNINEIINDIDCKFEDALNTHAPLKTKKVTVRKNFPWFNDKVKDQKQTVRRRERIWKKYRTPETWKAFNMERQKYKRMLYLAKKESISNKIIECGNNSKTLYNFVANLTNTIQENPLPEHLDPEKLSNEFADYFIGKIQTIRDNLDHYEKYYPTMTNNMKLAQFEEMSESSVAKILSRMKPKSCENDPIPANLIKKGVSHIIPTLTKLVNISLQFGVFPDKWKMAIIRPLLKKAGLDQCYCNYRPVSNLPFLSKLLEKVVLEQFNIHCEKYNLMPDYQSAYRSGYSCETALVKVVNDILWDMENQKVSAMVAVDLSAAFDTVDHGILLHVLQNRFGITESALDWFESYLRPRYCKVKIRNKYSRPLDLTFSVPQGSCAGPVLYLAYASTLQEVIDPTISLYGYADDHAVCRSFKASDKISETETIKSLENCAIQIKNWMDTNRLKMNSSKTEFMYYETAKQLAKSEIHQIDINGDWVDRVSKMKYLGVWLDDQLNLKHHITMKCRTAMLNLQRIKLIRQYITKEACHTLVRGLVISHLDYSNAIFCGLPNCTIKKLERVQRIAARLICGVKKYDSITEHMKSLHWLPIRLQLYNSTTVSMVQHQNISKF